MVPSETDVHGGSQGLGAADPRAGSSSAGPAQNQLLRAALEGARSSLDRDAAADSDAAHTAHQPSLAGAPQPVPVGARRSKRTSVKKLATSKGGRPGVIRRPSFDTDALHSPLPEHEPSVQHTDPTQLPPPSTRKGFQTQSSIERAHSPSDVFEGQIRKVDGKKPAKRGRKATGQPEAESAVGMFGVTGGHPSNQQILDMRTPGKAREDTPFLLPLLPAMLIAAVGTYLWFQASVRLLSYLPLAPIIIGLLIGGIMRLGTRSVDFARVIFAVLITAFSTFWGHAAIKDFGPLNEVSALKINWSTPPHVANPAGLISSFHATAEQSLGRATIMFAGLMAAGLLASLTPK
jgi:hypothetical protein